MDAPARQYKSITFRPLPQSGINSMGQWIVKESWSDIFNTETAHEKALRFQDTIMSKLNTFLPLKTIKISSDDQPCFVEDSTDATH